MLCAQIRLASLKRVAYLKSTKNILTGKMKLLKNDTQVC